VSDAWTHVLAHHGVFVETGELTRTRSEQARKWLWEELTDQVTAWLRTDAAMAQALAACEAAVVRGELAPPAAAARILSNLSPIR
jgi:putative protein kinase ArgK-like GTPase of G3E family